MSVTYSAVTFSNYGYRDFTHNLLNSIKVNNVDLNPNVYALDVEAFNYFKSFHENVTLFEDQQTQKELVNQKAENFGDMMMKKFEIIYKSMLENDYVLYIDGDIVIKKNIIEILFRNIQRPSN